MSRTEKTAGRNVVIIGAGYAGVIAANRIRTSLTAEESASVQITMVNPRREFIERIRLHELAAGSRTTVAISLDEMLHRDIRIIECVAERIDPHTSTVYVIADTTAMNLRFDVLVDAVGSTASAAIAGSRDHAFLLADLEGAELARDAIRAGASGQRVVVIGGGPTGVETASEIAEQESVDLGAGVLNASEASRRRQGSAGLQRSLSLGSNMHRHDSFAVLAKPIDRSHRRHRSQPHGEPDHPLVDSSGRRAAAGPTDEQWWLATA